MGTMELGLSLICASTQTSMREGSRLSSRREGVGTMEVGLSLACASTQTSMREGRSTQSKRAESVFLVWAG